MSGANRSSAVMQQRSEPHEEWRAIEGWPGYEVSALGRVRSWKQRTKGRKWAVDRHQTPRILRPEVRNGYRAVLLSELGKKSRKASIQRLVLAAFVGPQPSSIHAAHQNGIKTDNRLANLRWATPPDNNADKIQHGTRQNGERAGSAKLNWQSVAAIRERRSAGEGVSALAREFGVCRNTITNITTGRTWEAS